MTFNMPTLSRPFAEAVDEHTVIVIGSGYGGGVAASRMARAGQAVTVLERGREVQPGDYPREMSHMTSEFQVHLSQTGEVMGKPNGLYDLRINDDMNVLVGCGLGGTSLINANVAIEVDPRVFADWPAPYRDDPDLLAPYYARAREMLGSTPYPSHKTKPKFAALQKVAEGLEAPCVRPDINVTFEGQTTKAGLWQPPCNDCGDCVSGCNYGAKNTVLMNYLLDAWRHNAQIFTGANVTRICKDGDAWKVIVGDRILTADMVILAAGTLGSTEILLRSQTDDQTQNPYDDLLFSDQLGQRFSGNGDVWAVGYNANMKEGDERLPAYGIGAGDRDVDDTTPDRYRPGPCITGMIDLQDRTDQLEDGLIIQEGAIPGALAMGYAAGFPMWAALMGDPFRFGDVAQRLGDIAEIAEQVSDDPAILAETSYTGPVSRTLPFLVMSHDASDGALVLKNDSVVVDWPDAGLDPALVADAEILKTGSDAIHAEYLSMPFWQDAMGNRAMAVHPIGGCGMGDDVSCGVINADCAVFDRNGQVHKGLYVMDGAALPGGVGVNPHLTITAVAERAVERLCAGKNWEIDWADLPPLEMPDSADKESDWKALLETLIGLMKAVADAADLDKRSKLRTLWIAVVFAYGKHTSAQIQQQFPVISWSDLDALLTDDHIRDTITPIIVQMLDVVVPLHAALTEESDPWTILEDHMGDFSPPVTLFETMIGDVSAVGLNDKPQPRDPYAVAATGGAACTLETEMHAETLRKAITPPDGIADIVGGTFRAPTLGGDFDVSGTFQIFVPNPDEIECWEMRYIGEFTPRDHNGPPLSFKGIKTLKRREGSHWWTDLTEIDLDVSGPDGLVARGRLKVTFEEAMRQYSKVSIAFAHGGLREAFANAYEALQCDGDTIHKLAIVFQDQRFRANLVKGAAFLLDDQTRQTLTKPPAQTAIENRSKRQIGARFATLVMRTYGSIYAYMVNFPADEAGFDIAPADLPAPQIYEPDVGNGEKVKLTRYQGGSKGPVMLAGGFGTKASSFALSTVDINFVQALVADNYDVWLFDYRGSGDIASSRVPFTIDDVALSDWPAAISCVLNNTDDSVTDVQVVVHCVGSISLFMALLAGEDRVRSVIASQTGPHAVTNYANYAKADSDLARYVGGGLPETMWGLVDMLNLGPTLTDLAKHGLPVVEPRSPSKVILSPDFDQVMDGLLWDAPLSAPIDCYSPTCHRVNFFFGPSYHHPQLNQATHNAISHLFGPVHPKPFQHIAAMFAAGHVQSFDGKTNYLDRVSRLTMPIHFIAGACNQEMMPEATLRSLKWLHDAFPDQNDRYTRHVFQDYGHMDCFIGKTASDDIFPHLLDVLNNTA